VSQVLVNSRRCRIRRIWGRLILFERICCRSTTWPVDPVYSKPHFPHFKGHLCHSRFKVNIVDLHEVAFTVCQPITQLQRELNFLHILPGESDTRLKNSNLFTCHASNHLCSYPRSKPMSNSPGLDLDHHVSLIGSCLLVAHHVPQHILQSVGSISNLEGCHIVGYTLKDVLLNIHLWPLFSVQVFQSLS
jgi:hypothetical protein